MTRRFQEQAVYITLTITLTKLTEHVHTDVKSMNVNQFKNFNLFEYTYIPIQKLTEEIKYNTLLQLFKNISPSRLVQCDTPPQVAMQYFREEKTKA